MNIYLMDSGKMKTQLCDHCKMDLKIRNPSGFCDHLYYPENCKTCFELECEKSKKEIKRMSARTTKAILTLECKLTDVELKECSKKLAEAISNHSRVENQIETFKAQKKGELQQLEGTIAEMSEKVNREKEFRPVECEVKYDFGTGIKSYIRKDTGEECKTETMSESERQEEMALANETNTVKKKK